MLRLTPSAHRDEYHYGRCPDGRAVGTGPQFSVGLSEDEPDGYVHLTLDPHHAETIDDRDIDRLLVAAEARALAAALWHFADEAERGR
jgi:hypothetical protein